MLLFSYYTLTYEPGTKYTKLKDKQTEIKVRFEEDTVWLTQQQMTELFGQTKQNISLHINKYYREKEL